MKRSLVLRALFTVTGGYLLVDDTVVEKPYARLLGEAAWVWSSKQRKVVFGVSVVLLVRRYAGVEIRIKKGREAPWGGRPLCLSRCG